MSSTPLTRELQQMLPQPASRRLGEWIADELRAFLRCGEGEEPGAGQTFLELGFDSLMAVDFKDRLAAGLGLELPSTLVFDHPTSSALHAHLGSLLGLVAPSGTTGDDPATPRVDVANLPPEELRALASRQAAALRAMTAAASEPIAIVGMACRFPGAEDPEALWRLCVEGRDAITEVPNDRFDVDALYDTDPSAPGKMYTRRGGFLDRIDTFDAAFFGISPREAIQLDPQQRLLLETSWHTLEDAGISPDALTGRPVGVFVGVRASEYFDSQCDRLPEDAESYYATGNAISTAAGRISYTLGFTGPCFALDTACSASLVAVHQAVRSLRQGECTAALAGGVNLIIDPISTISICKANMLAADGRCKTFDASADGYGRAEGCGMALLKRLSDARRDGDRIHAVIRGSAINQDGRSGGLTVPHGPSQEAVIRQALRDAGLNAADVDFIEAHGTGTALGDPIEVGALDAVFGGRPGKLPVASVKTNLGHLECAAGIAGLIKAVQSLRHEKIPPHLHLNEPNPHIPWARSVVRVPTTAEPWPRCERPRRAGISSFGFSGTNAHAVIEEAPPPADRRDSAPGPHVLLLSARDEAALKSVVESYAEWLHGHPDLDLDLDDLCANAALGRKHLPRRLAFVAEHRDALLDGLGRTARGSDIGSPAAEDPRVAFLFTGQGAQYAGMGRELYDSEPVYRETLDACAQALAPHLDHPLRELLWGERSGLLHQTEYTQPALFAVGYALARLWQSWGVQPAVMLGHSVGEYAAACLAGVFSLEDAAGLIAARGRLMRDLTEPGAMAAVFAAPDRVAHTLRNGDRIAVAACNGPANTVVSGEPAAVQRVLEVLRLDGVEHQTLDVSRAFHSPLMDPMLAEFRKVAEQVDYRPLQLPIQSLLEPRAEAGDFATPDYWVRHVRQPVLFEDGARALSDRADVLLEIGPQPVLLGMARRFVDRRDLVWVPSLHRGRSDLHTIRRAAGELHVAGARVDWRAVRGTRPYRRLALPPYPFQRERYWLQGKSTGQPNRAEGHPLLGRRMSLAVLGDDEALFETWLSEAHPAWLDDHRVFGQALVPGAAFLEMALCVGSAVLGTDDLELQGAAVQAPLAVGREPTRVQLHLQAEGDGHAFRLLSRAAEHAGDERWILHARGRIRRRAETKADTADLDAWRAACPGEREPRRLYDSFAEVGLDYGPTFRPIVALRVAEDRALARIELAESLDLAGHRLHPALLDACFQATAAAVDPDGLDETWLPLGVESLRLHRVPGRAALCRAAVRRRAEGGHGAMLLDVELADEAGRILAVVEGLQLVRASPESLLATGDSVARLLHTVQWSRRERAGATADARGAWILQGDDGVLARALAAAGGQVVTPRPDSLAAAVEAAGDGLRGVVFAANESANPGDLCAGVVRIAQTLVRARPTPRLWLLTRGAQPAGAPAPQSWAQAALHGLANAVAIEHPELQVGCIDRDPRRAPDEADAMVAELCGPDEERRVALRAGERLVPRLLQGSAPGWLPVPDGPFALRIPEYGVLERLALVPAARRGPGPGEIEIAVEAAALNFKDVLHALGMLREFSASRAVEQSFGFECVGRVVAVGEGVSGYAVGDPVLASLSGCMGSHVTAPVAAVTPRPAGLDTVQAAAVQTVFLTALYALERLADVRAGDTVLVHAAAGGVGQAALQLCRRRGCKVIATASASKQDWLRRQGVEHVFDSRSLDFAEQVLQATGGRGADVVLNCLSGDAVAASARALAEGGRFVEIGKLDNWTPERFAAERPDARYWIFDLSDTFARDPALLRSLLADLRSGFADGSLQPLPVTVFPLQEAPKAFAWLAQARNIGKVVLQVPPPSDRPLVRKDASYLVTGGLGALGRSVARWLCEQGATHVVLAGRSPPDESARSELAEQLGEGVALQIARCDVADPAQVQGLVERVHPPLAGIVHAAGVLDDAMLIHQDPDRLARVLAPKAEGAWNLHRATAGTELDFFVCFSSMAALLGNAGQGAYAAANAAMDAIAWHRRALGLPATTVQWGPWSGGGMAAALGAREQARLAEIGLARIAPEIGLLALGRILREGRPQVAVLSVKWLRFVKQFRSGIPPLLSAFAGQASVAAQRHELLDELREAPEAERLDLVRAAVADQLASVLGFASGKDLDVQAKFPDLGVDSLMAVEMRNRLEALLDSTLPATLLFDHPSVALLAAHLASEVAQRFGDTVEVPRPEETAELEDLDEDQLADLLAEQIRAMTGPEDRQP